MISYASRSTPFSTEMTPAKQTQVHMQSIKWYQSNNVIS